MVRIVKRPASSDGFTSDQASGVDTGARGKRRTHQGARHGANAVGLELVDFCPRLGAHRPGEIGLGHRGQVDYEFTGALDERARFNRDVRYRSR